jgi:hypothetical protein
MWLVWGLLWVGCCGEDGFQLDGLFVACVGFFQLWAVAQYGLKSLCRWVLYFSEGV